MHLTYFFFFFFHPPLSFWEILTEKQNKEDYHYWLWCLKRGKPRSMYVLFMNSVNQQDHNCWFEMDGNGDRQGESHFACWSSFFECCFPLSWRPYHLQCLLIITKILELKISNSLLFFLSPLNHGTFSALLGKLHEQNILVCYPKLYFIFVFICCVLVWPFSFSFKLLHFRS